MLILAHGWMKLMGLLEGKTAFITGSSRGIGREIALRLAKEGANIVILAKTSEPHPKLKGTIHTVAKEIEALGAKALPLAVDVRFEEAVEAAVARAVATFGGIDFLVNNASAIQLSPTLDTEMKRFDLMFGVNVRATFLCSKACIPYLKQSKNAHILNMSPPLSMKAKWFRDHVAYSMSKYGMSMCTLGMAAELKPYGISVNSLWPKTTIATAAIENNFPKELIEASRKPSIVADAVYALFTRAGEKKTGEFLVDQSVLEEAGVKDFSDYAVNPKVPLMPDFFLD
jgi:citronellol/citronellal dehydrogenase